MKYVFNIPLAQTGPGVIDGYVVSHSMFLTEQQRQLLQEETVETIGACVPVRVRNGVTNEPANEIFCKYKISPFTNDKKVVQTSMGWELYLPEPRPLKNVKDEGSEFLSTVYHDIVLINETAYPVLHQITIADLSYLERNMHCCHLPHTVSK